MAAKRGCYAQLQQADLLTKLPFETNTFDYLLCIGTTSYLGNTHKNRFEGFAKSFFGLMKSFPKRDDLNWKNFVWKWVQKVFDELEIYCQWPMTSGRLVYH